MKYPLLKEKACFPKNHKCPICKKNLIGNFVVLMGGALFGSKQNASMDKRMLGFLTLNGHFDSDDKYSIEDFAENTPMGQFEAYTCSYKCMKKLLNDFVDQAEKKHKKSKKLK